MKKFGLIVLSFCLFFILVPFSQVNAENTVPEISYDFSQEAHMSGFTASAGSWSVKDGEMVQTNANVPQGSFLYFNKAFVDFEISFKMGYGEERSAGAKIGFAFQKQRFKDDATASGYNLYLDTSGTLTVSIDSVYPSRVLGEKKNAVSDITAMTQYKIVSQGGSYQIFVGDMSEAAITFTDDYFVCGFLSFLVSATTMRVDDFSVKGEVYLTSNDVGTVTGIGGEFGHDELTGLLDKEEADKEFDSAVRPNDWENSSSQDWQGQMLENLDGKKLSVNDSTATVRFVPGIVNILLWVVGGALLVASGVLFGFTVFKSKKKGGKKDE